MHYIFQLRIDLDILTAYSFVIFKLCPEKDYECNIGCRMLGRRSATHNPPVILVVGLPSIWERAIRIRMHKMQPTEITVPSYLAFSVAMPYRESCTDIYTVIPFYLIHCIYNLHVRVLRFSPTCIRWSTPLTSLPRFDGLYRDACTLAISLCLNHFLQSKIDNYSLYSHYKS